MSDFDNLIEAIKEQYHEDVALMDMIYHLDKEYENKIQLLKDNGVGYTISDYTDEELINLKDEILLKVCIKNIYELIYHYNGYFYVDAANIRYDELEDIFYIDFAQINSEGSFEVSIYELRNPELFKERIRNDRIIELENKIESLKIELYSLKNCKEKQSFLIKSFIKWTGSKRLQSSCIVYKFPDNISTY